MIRVAHWFNPLAWYGFKRLQDDQELSCDARAIRYLTPEAVQEYGRTLIRVLEFAGPQPSQLISATIIFEYYAKGVGMVKKEFTSGDMKVTSTLKSYHLVK